jgi:hypothetical protein
LYLAVTDFNLVRELPTGRAEILVSGSADAVGRRVLRKSSDIDFVGPIRTRVRNVREYFWGKTP